MKFISLFFISCLATQVGFYADSEVFFSENLSEEASDKALKKLQAQTDSEEALGLLKAYFDNACSRVFNVRLAKEAEFRKVRCDAELSQAADLAKISSLRKLSIKMQNVKDAAVKTHDNVLVKEKRVNAIKSLGSNPLYKANKSKLDNLFASLETLVKKTTTSLVAKADELLALPKAKQTAYLTTTHATVSAFLVDVNKLRAKADAIIKPA